MTAMHHHATGEFARATQAERIAVARKRQRPAPASEDLEHLVATAAQGDEAAWTALVTRFGPNLLRVARAHGLSAHEAEDAVQETWVRFLRNIARLREPRALGGWLATTARNESLRVHERGRRERPTADELRLDTVDTTTEEAQDELDAAARHAAVTRALDLLPPRHRALMSALFASDEPSYQEIADRLQMPVGSIGPIRGRCLRQLRLHGRIAQLAD